MAETPQFADRSMTPDDIEAWLAEMKAAGLGRSAAACSRLLGIHPNAMVKMRNRGADVRTALACRALLHRLAPYQRGDSAPPAPASGAE